MELSRLAKFATCPVLARHWFVPWLKGLQALGRESLNIPISKPSFRRNWYSRKKKEKKLQTIKFARQYRISHCKSPSIELFVLDIYYIFISLVQKFSLLLHLTRRIIHHISLPCRSQAHRDGGLKANRSLAFSITIWKRSNLYRRKYYVWSQHVWLTLTETSLLWIHVQRQRFDRLFSNLDCVALLLGESDAFLIKNAPPFLSK